MTEIKYPAPIGTGKGNLEQIKTLQANCYSYLKDQSITNLLAFIILQ